jgi:hypothetical protein
MDLGSAGGATDHGAASGPVRGVGRGDVTAGRTVGPGPGGPAARDRRGWRDGAGSTAPRHAEGENPLARDQGGDLSAPGQAADPPPRQSPHPPLPAPGSGGGGYDRCLDAPGVAGGRPARGAHGGAGGVASGWRSRFLARIPARLAGSRGHRTVSLLPCRAHPVHRCHRRAGWADSRLPAMGCRVTSPAAPQPRAAGVGGISRPGRTRVVP